VLAEALGLHPGAIASDAKPGSQQGWDSLAHMKLVLAIETARGHRLTSSEILALTSLDGINQALQNSGTRPG
jgi:acyl carrier protein